MMGGCSTNRASQAPHHGLLKGCIPTSGAPGRGVVTVGPWDPAAALGGPDVDSLEALDPMYTGQHARLRTTTRYAKVQQHAVNPETLWCVGIPKTSTPPATRAAQVFTSVLTSEAQAWWRLMHRL
jgi:hypothetical protein